MLSSRDKMKWGITLDCESELLGGKKDLEECLVDYSGISRIREVFQYIMSFLDPRNK